MPKFRHYWEVFRTSFWFLPAVMTMFAAALALLSVRLDGAIHDHWLRELEWVYSGSAEGARQLLATVAGSMVTVAGVVFSVTVVALSLTSSQFGPRLLRNFMRDQGNQVVLGTFIATFVFCLLVLRTVRGNEGAEFVPHLSVTLALVLALASLGVLIYFIHHAAVSMQAPQVIGNVSGELKASIATLFPEELGEEPDETLPEGGNIPDEFERESRPVRASADGYVQLIDEETLMQLATDHDFVLRVVHRPGHFVVKGAALCLVCPGRLARELADPIHDAFVLGLQQTPTQDVEFAVNQLVEIAVRALSPGINDPFTAMTCIDHLGAALCRLARRRMPSPYRYDKNGHLRVIAYPLTFADVADAAFRQIRHYGRLSTAVLMRLLETIEVVLKHARRADDRTALLRQALIVCKFSEELTQPVEQQAVAARYRALLENDDSLQHQDVATFND